MKNIYVVYKIKFEDGSLYVGHTRDITKRMYEHKHRSKTSELPLYKTMRDNKYEVEIVVGKIANKELANHIEKVVTKYYKNKGFKMLNILNTVEEKIRVYKDVTGQNHHKSKPLSYYEENAVLRKTFKITCGRQGWNYEEFKEVEVGTNKYGQRLYKYF